MPELGRPTPLVPDPTQKPAAKNFKRPKNREDGFDLDDFLTESIASMQIIISEILEKIDCVQTIDSVKKSSKSEPSSRFFGRLKFSAVLGVVRWGGGGEKEGKP